MTLKTLSIKLIEIIQKEVLVFQQLLGQLEDEQKALVENNIERLQSSIEKQKAQSKEAERLEAGRIEIMEAISRQLNLSSEEVTFLKLMELIESVHANQLGAMRETLLELNRRIKRANEHNAFLIRQSMKYVQSSLNILTGAYGSKRLYERSGAIGGGPSDSAMLNRIA